MYLPKNSKGFTLVELMLVVVIIAILAGITYQVINLDGQRNRAQDGVRESHLKTLSSGIEAYRAAQGRYPADANEAGLDIYIATWPNDEDLDSGDYNYDYEVFTNDTFKVRVSAESFEGHYSYYSDDGEIHKCPDDSPSPDIAC